MRRRRRLGRLRDTQLGADEQVIGIVENIEIGPEYPVGKMRVAVIALGELGQDLTFGHNVLGEQRRVIALEIGDGIGIELGESLL